MPPVRSGIAACSAELVPALRAAHDIDVYVDEPVAKLNPSTRSAHEFVWRHRQSPYELTVFELGNSSHHDYIWPYLFRYPGLAVLHDAQLHHARAASLLRTRRAADYRAEFAANHPDATADLAELAVKGYDTHLYYWWPMTRLVAQASRLTAVHAPALAAQLDAELPGIDVMPLRLAHGTPVSADDAAEARVRVREALGIPAGAVLFGVFGGLTPEKRIPQVLAAFAALLPYASSARLLLAGAAASHYDVMADVQAHGLADRVTIAGYLQTDEELTDAIAATDVALNLRWPTAREMSGPWLRALAAGKPTVIIDLAHLADVPSLDPRTWRAPSAERRTPVAVAIDILDEDHSLRLAMRRLAVDAALRAQLGAAARDYWAANHSMPCMIEDYERAIVRAASRPAPRVPLPPHLVTDGDATLRAVLNEVGVRLEM
jgi:glycosyltransferase involved in cell wall biosynthesis